MEDELYPHLQYVSQLSREVVFIVLVLQLGQLLLPVERDAADLKVVRPRRDDPFLTQMQVADTLPLVDFEETLFVPVVYTVAQVVSECGQGWGKLEDVVAVGEVADVQVQLERVFDVHAGQAYCIILSELKGEKNTKSKFRFYQN